MWGVRTSHFQALGLESLQKAHRATAVALVAMFDRESIQESDNHNSSQPLVLKSHQRVRRATGVAPCDKESIQESESKPLGLNLHQKACTATGAAPFDKESIQESENHIPRSLKVLKMKVIDEIDASSSRSTAPCIHMLSIHCGGVVS